MNRYVTWITDYVLQHRIGTVILPRWDGIKDKIRHGKRGNQNFVQVPFHKFRQKLKSKCERGMVSGSMTRTMRRTPRRWTLSRSTRSENRPMGGSGGSSEDCTGVLWAP
jgi:IS605 OrfB family transposase